MVAAPVAGAAAAEDTPAAAPDAAADPGTKAADGMIIGIAGAAAYLGYDKPDSFRRARTRRPVPGETRTSDGRPAWTPAALRAWRATAPGNLGNPGATQEPGFTDP